VPSYGTTFDRRKIFSWASVSISQVPAAHEVAMRVYLFSGLRENYATKDFLLFA
jgi:hypothetical protein